ncbi:MAG TPA: 50S ribosomal protein L11 methyltransferase [Planktothrix sp.]
MSASKQRTWAAVEFQIAAENEELAGWVLVDQLGAAGCEVTFIAGTDLVLIRATFDDGEASLSEIKTALQQHGLEAQHLQLCTIEEEDWLAKFKEGFKPFNSGEKLIVCPPWERETAEAGAAGRKVLIVEPAMAFGTGLHATTRFCLRAIETQPVGEKILDVGTGSGILAIAAVLLHPTAHVVAFDNDPVATENAELNCRYNNIGDRLQLFTGTIDLFAGQRFDSILSNITCEDIVALLPEYRELLEPGAIVICAGILTEKRPLLEKALPTSGFSIVHCEEDGQWTGSVLRKA